MEKPVLILTVGFPRSGKSTWSRATGLPVVNPDSIRLAIHGRPHYPEKEGQVWAVAELMVRSLFIAGHKTVILDATNLIRRYRDRWLSEDWNVKLHVFRTPIDVCIERCHAGGRLDLIPVIERMAENMDPWPESDL